MYAPSTVALTIYNLTVVNQGPIELSTLRARVDATEQLPGVTADSYAAALEGLLDRGWMSLTEGQIDVTAAKRLIVMSRDRTDADARDDDGVLTGGWLGWTSKCPRSGAISIEDNRPEELTE